MTAPPLAPPARALPSPPSAKSEEPCALASDRPSGPKGKKIEDHGNYVTVWKKVDGQWKVLSDINSSEVSGAM
jgi:hypothetical protein